MIYVSLNNESKIYVFSFQHVSVQWSECKSGSFSLINHNLNLNSLLCVCSLISTWQCLRTGWQTLRDSRPKPTMWPTPRWSPQGGWCPWWPRWSVVKDHKMEPWGNVLEPSHGWEYPGHAQHPGGADQPDWEQPGHHQRRDEGGWQGPDWDGEMVRTVCLSLEQVRPTFLNKGEEGEKHISAHHNMGAWCSDLTFVCLSVGLPLSFSRSIFCWW